MTTTAPHAAPQEYGEVFTRRWVVEALLDLTQYTTDRDLGAMTAVEPAAGTGAFLVPMIERLLTSAKAFGRPYSTLSDSIRAWELKPANVQRLRSQVHNVLTDAGASASEAQELMASWIIAGDFLIPSGSDLLSESTDEVTADVVIGNPPYIRLEDLPEGLFDAYRRQWPTMGGRADVYVGFYERSLSMLKPGGRLGFICADRWMRNQYGTQLRRLVAQAFSVDAIWVMHDVDAFETKVSAYPAITLISRKRQGKAIVADTTEAFNQRSARRLIEWSAANQISFTAPGVSAHRLAGWFGGAESWPTGSPAELRLVETLSKKFSPLHSARTRTKVSIGVATGADKIFVTRDPHAAEADRMLPLATVADIGSGKFKWTGQFLLNPWNPDGQLVDLSDYPRLVAEYSKPGSTLRTRHVAKKAPHNWYRTIDKVNHELTNKPKLLLQDMKATIHPVLEPGGFYPHHNLYYVVSECWDLEVLGGLLLSRIAETYIAAHCVKMRGGTLRFQAQYLKRLPVPDPESIAPNVARNLREAFRNRDVSKATAAAAAAYGVDLSEVDLDDA